MSTNSKISAGIHAHPHDQFFKKTFSHPTIARDFLQLHLPDELLKRLDFSSLKQEKSSFVDTILEEHYSDLVLSCSLDNKPGYLYFLVEHQSSPDMLLPLRMHKYVVMLLETWSKEPKNRNKKLPIIVPKCIYHGSRSPYPYAKNIYDLFVDSRLARDYFGNFDLIDLSMLRVSDFKKYKTSGLITMLLQGSTKRNYESILEKSKELGLFETLEDNLLFNHVIDNIIVYLSNVCTSSEIDRTFTRLKKHLPQTQLNMITHAESKIREGISIGKQKGISIGEKRGKEQGRQEGILSIAQKMFLRGIPIEDIEQLTGLSKEDFVKR